MATAIDPLRPGFAVPLVVGHRGAAALAPESTAAAFRAAGAAGARWVETDVRLTDDGVLVLHHDDDLTRTTDAAARAIAAGTALEELPWSRLATLDAGSWFAPEFAGQRLVSLSDLALLARELDLAVDLELKTPTHHEASDVVDALQTALRGPEWFDLVVDGRVMVTSFDPDLVRLAVARLPVPVGLLTASTPDPADVAELAGSGVAALVSSQEDTTAQAVAAAHEVGLAYWVYTANTAADWDRLVEAGVDAICTDDPGALLGHLALRGEGGRSGGGSD